MDLAQLRAAQPERLYRAADRINRVRDGLRDAAERVQANVRQPLAGGVWSGKASAAALAHFDRVGKEVAATAGTLGQAGPGVMRLADALADAKALLARAEDIAGAARLTIGTDGSITFPTFTTPLTEAEAQSLKAAGEEAHQLLAKALTLANEADAACAGALATASGAVEAAGSAVGSSFGQGQGSPSGGSDGGGGGDGIVDTVAGWFDDPETDFDDTLLGDLTDGDLWHDTNDDDGFHIGDMDPMEEEAFAEVFQLPEGTDVDDLLGEETVDTIEEEGFAAGLGAWWDESWEDMGNVPDRISDGWHDLSEGVGNFAEDPIGTIGGMFD